ncbi:MAG: ribose 5-phosphate isomerase B [Candidatus Dadabacteria bacterium]
MNPMLDISKPIAIGADHAGFVYKNLILSLLQEKGLSTQDYGTSSPDSVDYPDFAHPVAKAIEDGESGCGILVCGTANGVAITANKHQDVRAAIAWNAEIAALTRQHNNANVLCIPSRFISPEKVAEMVTVFLNTAFEGGRHQKRVEKITGL